MKKEKKKNIKIQEPKQPEPIIESVLEKEIPEEDARKSVRFILRGIGIFIIILLLFSFISSLVKKRQRVDIATENRTYRNEEFGFELKYPVDIQEGDGSLEIAGSKNSSLINISYYQNQNIQFIIDDFKRENIDESDFSVVEEKDVKINTCTARKIVLQSPDGELSNFHFVSKGSHTYMLKWREPTSDQERKDLDQTLNTFTCI